MCRMGVWERDEGVAEVVAAVMGRLRRPLPELARGSHPAQLAGDPLDLLCISPGAIGWAGAGTIHSRIVLLPGAAGPLARGLQAERAVSYGASARDTLTISSMEGDQLCAALQRELVTVAGRPVERQELVLAFPPERSPLPLLCAVGALLLLGVTPEELMESPILPG